NIAVRVYRAPESADGIDDEGCDQAKSCRINERAFDAKRAFAIFEAAMMRTTLPRFPVTSSLAAVALCALAATAAPVAYVPNEGSATVSVIDTATDKVTATLKVAQK